MKLKRRIAALFIAFALLLVGVVPASAASGTSPDYRPVNYYVFAGSFTYKSNAYKRVAALKKQGYDAFVKVAYVNGKKFYRVQIGAFNSKANMNNYTKKVKKSGFDGVFVIPRKKGSY
ncbi:SPOR domain-containing protein [Thermoflavimicrobium daqui]|nr:SPOR domain-containing protein [Thermoflavimicrobium daqui]